MQMRDDRMQDVDMPAKESEHKAKVQLILAQNTVCGLILNLP